MLGSHTTKRIFLSPSARCCSYLNISPAKFPTQMHSWSRSWYPAHLKQQALDHGSEVAKHRFTLYVWISVASCRRTRIQLERVSYAVLSNKTKRQGSHILYADNGLIDVSGVLTIKVTHTACNLFVYISCMRLSAERLVPLLVRPGICCLLGSSLCAAPQPQHRLQEK